MPYATQPDLVTRFGSDELVQVTDRTNSNAIDASVVAARLADADALINGYLAPRYATPVTPTPQLLLTMAGDIARYLLWGDRATEAVRTAFEDALKLLRDLADGRAALAGAAPAPMGGVPAAAAGQVLVAAPERGLSGSGLAEYLG